MTFREKLIELRQLAGLTQIQLAEVSGVPLSSLRKYEQGARVHVPLGIAVRLAKAMGVDCTAFAQCSDIGTEGELPPTNPRAMGKRK